MNFIFNVIVLSINLLLSIFICILETFIHKAQINLNKRGICRSDHTNKISKALYIICKCSIDHYTLLQIYRCSRNLHSQSLDIPQQTWCLSVTILTKHLMKYILNINDLSIALLFSRLIDKVKTLYTKPRYTSTYMESVKVLPY